MGIFLGLGTNLGDKEQNIVKAIQALGKTPAIKVKRIAPLYKTPAWGHLDQDWFLNTVVEIETRLSAFQLLKEIKNIEKRMGRTPSHRWGPRVIDIDILLFNEEIVTNKNLQIPHLYLTERAFVLQPLLDLEPEIKHPVTKEPLRNCLEKLSERKELTRWARLIAIDELT